MRMILSLTCAIACFAGLARACDQCVQQATTLYIAAPARVEYRIVQPELVRETKTVERLEVQRDPVIYERSERVIEGRLGVYAPTPALIQGGGYGYSAALVKQRFVAPIVRERVFVQPQKVVIQKNVVAPTAVIQKQTVEKRGILGRLRQKSTSTTIVQP